MLSQELHERRLRVETERVVAQVDGLKVLEREEGSEEGGEGRGDLGEEARGEYVGEVDGVEGCLGGEERGEVRAGGGAEGVAVEGDGGVGCGCFERFHVFLGLFGGVELEAAIGEGEGCCGVGHFWRWSD